MFYESDATENRLNSLYTGWHSFEEEPGAFTGLLSAPFRGVGHAASVVAALPLSQSDATPDEYLGRLREETFQHVRESRPDPRNSGAVAQVVENISSVLTYGVLGSPGGIPGASASIGAFTGFDKYLEMKDQGVDPDTAMQTGVVTGTVMGVSAALAPYYGATILKQLATGIGMNVGAGMAERGITSGILANAGYEEMAGHYKTLDGMSMFIDAALGAAFVGGARFLKTRDIDTAMDANRIVADQSRGPLHTTREGLDSQTAANLEVARQIIEEGRAPHEITPPEVIGETLPNSMGTRAAVEATRAFADLYPVPDLAALARGVELPVRPAVEAEAPAARPPNVEAAPEDPAFALARRLTDTVKELRDENGVPVDANKVLDDAEVEFKRAEQDILVERAMLDCLIGG